MASFVSMGSDAEISGLNNGSGDPLGAAPKCLELEETENLEAIEMGNFDFMNGRSESIPCVGMSSVDAETSSGRGDPLVPGFLVKWVRNRGRRIWRPVHLLARDCRPRMSRLRLLWRTLMCQ